MATSARWMDLRYKGKCAICGRTLVAGDRAFYDPRDRTVTCTEIGCARANGLTKMKWVGSPVSGSEAEVLSDTRLASFVRDVPPRPARRYGGRRRTTYVRCTHEDYPCCGCER